MAGYHLKFTEHGRRQWGRTAFNAGPNHRLIRSKECAYCGLDISAGSKPVVKRVSHGFGQANKELLTFCSREHRGLYLERSPKWATNERSISMRLKTHRLEAFGQQERITACCDTLMDEEVPS